MMLNTLLRIAKDNYKCSRTLYYTYKKVTCHFSLQNLLLSRKSSASSTGSVDKSATSPTMTTATLSMSRKNLLRHDEHSVKSVRDKIALFSSSGGGGGARFHHQSSEDVASSSARLSSGLTRAHTHDDVRFDGGVGVNPAAATRGAGGTDKSVSSADLSYGKGTTEAKKRGMPSTAVQTRSQSLMEIGTTTSYAHRPSILEMQRRRNTVAKIKDLVIPEAPPQQAQDDAEWIVAGGIKKASRPPATRAIIPRRDSAAFSSPPVSPSHPSPSSRRSTRTSLAASPGGGRTQDRRRIQQEPRRGNSSSNVTEAISRHRMETQQDPNRKRTSISEFRAIEARELGGRPGSGGGAHHQQKQQPSPVHPKTVAASTGTITSLGKPASRSSSFTIAERKKSFEAISKGGLPTGPVSKKVSPNQRQLQHHSSQDSLALRRSSRDTLIEIRNKFSSVSSVASNASCRSSRDTISEDMGAAAIPPTPISISSSRRSSRSEADGGSRVTTPTKSGASGSGHLQDRSASATPTERCNSVVNVASQRTNPSPNSSSTGKAAANVRNDGYSRSTSAVSKDSGFTEEGSNKDSHDDERWLALEKKYSIQPAERPRDLMILDNPGDTNSTASREQETSPNSGKTIRKLTEQFESSSSPFTTPTSAIPPITTAAASSSKVEVLMMSASSSRRTSFMSQSNMEEFSCASFQLGESAGNFSWLEESLQASKPFFYLPEESTEWESFDPAETDFSNFNRMATPGHRGGASDQQHRKFSVPVYSSAGVGGGGGVQGAGGEVKMRDKKRDGNTAPSRPSSLVETSSSDIKRAFEMGHLGEHRSAANTVHSSSTNSRGSSQADLLSEAGGQNGDILVMPVGITGHVEEAAPLMKSSPLSAPATATSLLASGSSFGGRAEVSLGSSKDERRCISVNDIRRAFEKAEQSLSQSMAASSDCGGSPSSLSGGHSASVLRASQGKAGSTSSSSGGLSAPCHNRMSSLDSTTSEESSIPTPHYYGSVSSLLSGQTNLKDHYGSISSLASSTSIISPQVIVKVLPISKFAAMLLVMYYVLRTHSAFAGAPRPYRRGQPIPGRVRYAVARDHGDCAPPRVYVRLHRYHPGRGRGLREQRHHGESNSNK